MDSVLECIYEQYVVLSVKPYSNETVMVQVVLEDMERAEEHVLNFEGLIKGHRVLNHNRAYIGVRSYDDYFIVKKDAVGMIAFSCYQKRTTALRMLAYDTGR